MYLLIIQTIEGNDPTVSWSNKIIKKKLMESILAVQLPHF